MNTLEVISIKYASGYADLTICESSDNGERDGFESLRLTFDRLCGPGEAESDIEGQLQAIATERGLIYE